jgi:hypothetical protein
MCSRCGRIACQSSEQRGRLGQAAEPVLDDLTLLLHPVRREWARGPAGIVVWTWAEASAVPELAKPVGHAPRVVAQRAPGLVLGAVGQLVREHGERVAARVGQKDIVAEGDGAPTRKPKHERTERAAGRPASPAVEPHPPEIDGKREPGKHAGLDCSEPASATALVLCSWHLTSLMRPRLR